MTTEELRVRIASLEAALGKVRAAREAIYAMDHEALCMSCLSASRGVELLDAALGGPA